MATPCGTPPGPPFGYLCDDGVGDPVLENLVTVDGVPVVQGPLRFCGTGERVCLDDQVSSCISDTDGAPTTYGPAPASPAPSDVTGRSPRFSRLRLNRTGLKVFPYSTQKRPDQLIDIVIDGGGGPDVEVPWDEATGRFTLPEPAPSLVRCADGEPLTGSVPNCLFFDDGVTPVPVDEDNHPLIPTPITVGCSYVEEVVVDGHTEDPFSVGSVIAAGVPAALGLASVSWTNDTDCDASMSLQVALSQNVTGITSPMPAQSPRIVWSVNGAPATVFSYLGYFGIPQSPTRGGLVFNTAIQMGSLAPGQTLTVAMSEYIESAFNTLTVESGSWGFYLIRRRVVVT